jgi:acyl carrier protein
MTEALGQGTTESFERVRRLLADALEVDAERLTPDARFVGDIAVDSINAIIVLIALEEAFDIVISDEDAEHLTSTGEVMRYLEERGVV